MQTDSIVLLQLFQYQINVMRADIRKDSSQIQEHGNSYKEMYLDCKKKVAIFMGQVQAEIDKILKKHENEKRALQDEIEILKGEIKDQGHNTSMQFSKISIHSNKKRNCSETKNNSQSTISKETVEECLAKFSKVSLAAIEHHQKKSGFQRGNRREKRVNFRSQQQKQNRVTPVNFGAQLGDLKLLSVVPKRDTRTRQKKMDVENIKDVLKDLRGKLTSREKGAGSYLRERDQNIKAVITPELFASQKTKF